MDTALNGATYERRGNRDPYACPHAAYPCKDEDEWCVISVFDDEQWLSLLDVMGQPLWARDCKYITLMGRKAHEDELDQLVSQWTRDRSAQSVVHVLQKRGVPSGIAHTSEGLHNDPQLTYRSHFVNVEHAEMGMSPYESQAIRLAGTPCEIRRPAPLMGEHSQEVLTDILGMNDDEVLRLVEAGAIE